MARIGEFLYLSYQIAKERLSKALAENGIKSAMIDDPGRAVLAYWR